MRIFLNDLPSWGEFWEAFWLNIRCDWMGGSHVDHQGRIYWTDKSVDYDVWKTGIMDKLIYTPFEHEKHQTK